MYKWDVYEPVDGIELFSRFRSPFTFYIFISFFFGVGLGLVILIVLHIILNAMELSFTAELSEGVIIYIYV